MDRYRSDLERKVVEEWVPLQGWLFWAYEPKTFEMPGGRYTPDLMAVDNLTYRIVVVEIKGERRNRRATRKSFKELRFYYPRFDFCWLEWQNGGWKEEWHHSTDSMIAS